MLAQLIASVDYAPAADDATSCSSLNPNTKIARDAGCKSLAGDASLFPAALAAVEVVRAERHPHEVGNIACLHLLNDGGPVMFGRPRADAQLVRDELGRQPLQEKGEDFPFALGEQPLPSTELLHFEWSVAGGVAARQRFLDSHHY